MDDDRSKHGRRVAGLTVIGGGDDLPALLGKSASEAVVLSTTLDPHRLHAVLAACSEAGVEVLKLEVRLDPVGESLAGLVGASRDVPFSSPAGEAATLGHRSSRRPGSRPHRRYPSTRSGSVNINNAIHQKAVSSSQLGTRVEPVPRATPTRIQNTIPTSDEERIIVSEVTKEAPEPHNYAGGAVRNGSGDHLPRATAKSQHQERPEDDKSGEAQLSQNLEELIVRVLRRIPSTHEVRHESR